MGKADFIVVIPARYQSSRLPGKPLIEIAGKAMLLHVVEQARRSAAGAVYVATDDARIEALCREHSVQVCMTSKRHTTGTDRIEEVCRQLQLPAQALVVNVQGDEPLIPPEVIDQVARNLAGREEAGICTLYAPVESLEEYLNPNAVKLVCDEQGRVLYFSRAPIPCDRDAQGRSFALAKRHLGLYAYRVGVLQQFVRWAPSALEECEKLEQLRAMSHGVYIHAERCCRPLPPGVDTVEDLERVKAVLNAGVGLNPGRKEGVSDP